MKKTLLLLLCTVQLAWADYQDPQFFQDEVTAIERITDAWAHYLNTHEPTKIASLYDKDFTLHATLKNQISTQEALLSYFKKLTSKEDLKVDFDEETIRTYGVAALNSGTYTFSFTENGKHVEIPARFTFVFVLTPAGWRIVDHHSSTLPQ